MRERLSLAESVASELEKEVSVLKDENANLKAQIELIRINQEETKCELEAIKQKWSEDVRIFAGLEFRKGRITGDKWMAFCPKCHLPVIEEINGKITAFCNGKCGWLGVRIQRRLNELAGEIG